MGRENVVKNYARRARAEQDAKAAAKAVAKDAETKTTTRQDPEDGFIRTALVIDAKDAAKTGSIDVVDGTGKRLCQINISHGKAEGEEYLIVDVIDVDENFPQRRALHFTDQRRHAMDLGPEAVIVSTDFRRKL
jgi:hypothetical protein